jgi:PQQ-dependent catabolism-associated CXXCW motif protein
VRSKCRRPRAETVYFRAARLLALVLSCPLGASGDVPEPAGYWTGPINSPVPARISGGNVIDARRLAELLDAEHAVIIDSSNSPVRPAELAPGAPWLPLPHEAIPGSLWIPGSGAGEIDTAADDFFRERLAEATGGRPAHPIVVYCHERCWLSWNAAKRAISYGYTRVYWLPEGIEGWRAAGLDTSVVAAEGPAAAGSH